MSSAFASDGEPPPRTRGTIEEHSKSECQHQPSGSSFEPRRSYSELLVRSLEGAEEANPIMFNILAPQMQEIADSGKLLVLCQMMKHLWRGP